MGSAPTGRGQNRRDAGKIINFGPIVRHSSETEQDRYTK